MFVFPASNYHQKFERVYLKVVKDVYQNLYETFFFVSHVNTIRNTYINVRVRPRFFDQVGHQTTNASIGNKYFFTK